MVQLEAAIMVRLGAGAAAVSTDPQLASLAPGGVYSRTGGGETRPFITLTLVRMDEDATWRVPYRWRFRYGISGNDEGESIDAASAALQRVYELLQDAGDLMPMEDFTLGYIRRNARTQVTPNQSGVTYQRVTDEYKIEVYPK
jgi:hypothetical protein